ncbi:MAG: metallopeptidase family protein [Patescibacteria group bacterium]|nr:metallopeptidase family protein [Patescibacteria group bacterium]
MEREAFEKLVHEGFLLIPEKFRERIRNVALLVEDEPSEEVRQKEGLSEDETLLGLYQGIPATARGDSYGVGPTLPDTITLFQLPIEEAANGSLEEMRTIVAETIWHEYAHYFGMDEDAVRSREDGGTNRPKEDR